MTVPSLVFGSLVATLMGAAFHLWKGGGLGRLVLYLLLAFAGFWAGHFLGARMGWSFGSIGPLHFGMAVITAMLTIFVGYWLSLVRQEDDR
jgi:hypothetical protein